MDYREQPPAPGHAGLIKAWWTLGGDGAASDWVEQQATPDGCVEIIRRDRGRSRWGEAQPARFAVGLIERPEPFAISGDAQFSGIRLWPWAWRLLSDVPLAAMRGRWLPFAGIEIEKVAARLDGADALAATGRAILSAETVAAMSLATGMAPRALQRWFAAHVGLPPRRYLKLLRFQKAFEGVGEESSLADQAAAQGFADQAHMARAFRELAGVPARRARRAARGPFLT